ncbi:MAG: DNA polymerase IV, partial [Crocinitomicaceae bacterium]|nr:DNA polymerase IV [Crocinitomicaceae bacterium]
KTIPPEEVISFLEKLQIEKFFGVGKVTAEKMKLHGIFTGRDLKMKSVEYLTQYFGKSGRHFYSIVRGVQRSQVRPDRIRKSIAAERTFNKDISSEDFMLEKLEGISEELEKRLERADVKGKTITVKIKYSDFTQQTRSRTITEFISKKDEFFPTVIELIRQEPLKQSVRLLGVSITKLNAELDRKSVSAQLKLDF